MTYMLTRSARRFELAAPKASMVCIEDIAWHLALINRFCGATTRPYSVAEHCLLVTEILERSVPNINAMCLRAALLHDAPEAYTNDLSTPMKERIGQAWREAERPIVAAVEAHFGIAKAAQQFALAIKHADLVALATERRDLMAAHPDAWPCLEGVQPVAWIDLNDREGMEWSDWRLAYLCKHEEIADTLRVTEGWQGEG
jgi:hypothetical protein